MKTEFTTAPNLADLDLLTQKINEENPDFGNAYPFAFFIRDRNSNVVVGFNGSVVFGSIYTDQLWVKISWARAWQTIDK